MRFLFCALAVLMSCQQKSANVSNQETKEIKPEPGIFYSNVFFNSDSSFGYNIYQDSLLLIQQKTIPAVSGNTGFRDSASAACIAAFAIHKLQSGVFPPTIMVHEIDSILNNQ